MHRNILHRNRQGCASREPFIVAGNTMQLNLLNNINHLIEASSRTNRTLAEINGRVLGELLHNNMKTLQSAVTASTRVFTEHATPETQFTIVGKLTNEYLKSAIHSGKNVTEIVTKSRDDYEKWAVESAEDFGKLTKAIVPAPRT